MIAGARIHWNSEHVSWIITPHRQLLTSLSLVFMGSEKYPYKGIIDHLANRGYSNGTNAWTDTDHTAYTVSTAGEQGFLQILPIYVDHILYPTLTNAGFVTEVHHVDGKGEDSGVVYSEMQGRENTPWDLMALR